MTGNGGGWAIGDRSSAAGMWFLLLMAVAVSAPSLRNRQVAAVACTVAGCYSPPGMRHAGQPPASGSLLKRGLAELINVFLPGKGLKEVIGRWGDRKSLFRGFLVAGVVDSVKDIFVVIHGYVKTITTTVLHRGGRNHG